MKIKPKTQYLRLLTLLGIASIALSAHAGSDYHTASISSDGKVLAQSPDWIDKIEYSSDVSYLSTYKVIFKPTAYKEAPRFCSVSLADTRHEDDLYYGQGRLAALPAQDHVTVVTQLDVKKLSGDSSQSFMLMCLE